MSIFPNQVQLYKFDLLIILQPLFLDSDGNFEIKFQIPGLPPNVFPLSTRSKSKTSRIAQTMNRKMTFDYRDSSRTVYHITRKQLWILPAFAITVDSSQGRSLKQAMVHLDGHYTSASKPYVMLSRLMYGDNLHVLGSWDSELFDLKPDPHMLQFIENVLNPLEINTIDGIPRLQSSILALEQTFHSLRRTRPQN